MAFVAKRTALILFLSWSLVNANFVGAVPAQKEPRILLQQENQVVCNDINTCRNGNSYIFPLWQKHEAIYWRCNKPGMIALTFDDAPDSSSTPVILDELKRLGINATFFVSGKRIDAITKGILIRAESEGHTIASQTFDDVSMLGIDAERMVTFLNRQVYANEIEAEKYIREMKRYIRPPSLDINGAMADQLGANGYKIVMRNIATLDWKSNITNEEMIAEVMNGIPASQEAASKNSYITAQSGTTAESVALIDQIYQMYQDYYSFVNMETCLGDESEALESDPFPWTHEPSSAPSSKPSSVPSSAPSILPSDAPSSVPSFYDPFEVAGIRSGSSRRALQLGIPGGQYIVPALAVLLGCLL